MWTAWLLFGFTGVWCLLWLALIFMGVCNEKAEVYAPFACWFSVALALVHCTVWFIHNWQ